MSLQLGRDSLAHRFGDARSRGILLVVLAAIAWSSGGVGVKLVEADALSIAGWRSFFAAPVLLLVARWVGKPSGFELGAWLRRPLVWGAATAYATMVVTFVVAAKQTTAANAIFIQYMGPIYVAVLSWPLLQERLSRWDVAATAASVFGMALFFADEVGSVERWGTVAAVASGFGFAAMPLCLRLDQRSEMRAGARAEQVASSFSPLMTMALGNLLAVACCAPSMIASPPPSALGWGVVFGLGTVQIGLAYCFYASAVRKLPALESSLIACIEPVLNPIWVVLVVGEVPSSNAIAGGSIIVLAVVVKTLGARGRRLAEGGVGLRPDP